MSCLPHEHNANTEKLLQHMPNGEEFQTLASVFHQLGDSSRLQLFWLLCHCEECVINLSSIMGMSSPALSHHLRLLKDAGLIVSRRQGKEVYYKAADTDQVKALHHAFETLLAITCPGCV